MTHPGLRIEGLHPDWKPGSGMCCKCMGSLGIDPDADEETNQLIRKNRQMYTFSLPPAFGHKVCPE